MSDQAVIDAEKVKLIEDSFSRLYNEAFSKRFYEKLFAAHPDYAPLFKSGDPDEQESKLFKALMLASQTLRKPGAFKTSFKALGDRHASDYRVMKEYYANFVAILLDTMKEFAGREWTPPLEEAWHEALSKLVDVMVGER